MSVCSPNVDINIKDHYTCFEYDELKEIARAFNIYIQTKKVCASSNSKQDFCIPTKLIDIENKKCKNFEIINVLKEYDIEIINEDKKITTTKNVCALIRAL